EFAAGQKRNSPGSERSGRDVVAWCVGALLDRRNFAIATCVKCAVAAVQRNIAANSCAFDPGYIAQSIKSLFNETLTRRRVGILRNGQCDRAGPETLRAESNVLLSEANKTRDEQSRACQERDRQRDLRADENFTEPLLPRAASSTATALFQCVNQICMRALYRRINSHEQASQQRQRNREQKHRKRNARRGVRFERQKIRRHSRHERHEAPGDKRSGNSGNCAHEQALENEKSHHARARSADRHSQRDLPTTATKTNEQKIRHIAARDQQHETDCCKKGNETGSKILRYILWQRSDRCRERAIDFVGILRPITLIERWQRRLYLPKSHAGFHSANDAEKTGAAHHPLITESGKLKRFCRPNFSNRIRTEPGHRHIRQNSNDRVRHAVQSDAATDHIRIAAQPFLPKSFRDQRDICALFFLRQKVSAQNWMNAKNIEIVCGQSAPKNLNRITEPGQSEGKEILTRNRFEQSLALAIVHVSRRRDADLDQLARFVAAEEMNHTRRFLEWETPQEQIVDQTEDGRVQANPKRKREHRDEGERGRLSKFAKSESNIVHGRVRLSGFMKFIRHAVR